MNAKLSARLQCLERQQVQEVPEITRIIIAPGGDADHLHSVLMERQSDGTWKHEDVTSKPTGGDSNSP